MKTLVLISVAVVMLSLSVFAQQPSDTAIAEIKTLNDQLIARFKEQNFAEAQKLGLKMWSIAEKNDLRNDARVLPMLANLSGAYMAQDKINEGTAVLVKLLAGYEAATGDQRRRIAETSEALADIYLKKKSFKSAAELLLKALPLRIAVNGEMSRQTANVNRALAIAYRGAVEYDKAEPYYLRAIEINDVALTKAEQATRADIDEYECFVYHKALFDKKPELASAKLKSFHNSRKRDSAEDRLFYDGVVNGRAVKLVEPEYPMMMEGIDGFVLVRVLIDEQGNVTQAHATCGVVEFVKAVESAALKSKFTPATVNGQPVATNGVIVWNFRTTREFRP